MTQQQYYVKLSGKSQLHEPVIKLEDISVNLFSIDGGETWENKNISINVNGQLHVFMSCKAISGTGWQFTITNKLTDTKVMDKTGKTGEMGVPNFSEITDSVKP